MKDSFLTISNPCSAEIKVSKSKFISSAFPVSEKDAAQAIINDFKKKYYDASHFPFAFRIGMDMNDYRYSDDGEPSGSAGKPLLESIDKFDLTDLIVIVARYFGGVKLGVGGLRRAFFKAGEECLENAQIVNCLITKIVQIKFEYNFINTVMNLIEKEKINIKKNESKEKGNLTIEIRESKVDDLLSQLIEITNGDIEIKK